VSLWTILETRDAQKVLERAPAQVRDKYEVWKRVVAFSGPHGLHAVSGFKDEALRGEWKGHRSSRLSAQYRVIYRADAGTTKVHVERVSPHDYRR
jgi:addiction module RelE/StbE family toxin